MLDGDVLVLETPGLVFGLAEKPVETAADMPSAGGRLGETIELLLDPASQPTDIDVRLAENGNCQALVVLQEGKQQVLDVDLRVSRAAGACLGCRQRLLGLFREPIDVHPHTPVLAWLWCIAGRVSILFPLLKRIHHRVTEGTEKTNCA